MPLAPPKPCATCGRLQCQQHTRKAWQPSTPVRRIRGRELQRIREAHYLEQPWCSYCQRALPFTSRDYIIDHRQNLAAGGTDTPENRQPMCKDCHTAKTEREAIRGRGFA
jgi:5-methylcytosine-specific restriction enzyme A